MERARPRVLVLSVEKGVAEMVHRGLAGLRGVDLEVDVVLEEPAARRQFQDRRYDLFVFGSPEVPEPGDPVFELVPPEVPILTVGGPPNGRGAVAAGYPRVPLPLSYNLLRIAVLDVLRVAPTVEPGEHGWRDSVG